MARGSIERYDFEDGYYSEDQELEAPVPVKNRLASLSGLMLVIICSSALLCCYGQVMLIGYQINDAQEELGLLRLESNDLYTRTNQLYSLENIRDIAINRVGMVEAQSEADRVLFVDGSGLAATASSEDLEPEEPAEPEAKSWFQKLSDVWKVSVQTPQPGVDG